MAQTPKIPSSVGRSQNRQLNLGISLMFSQTLTKTTSFHMTLKKTSKFIQLKETSIPQ